MFSGTGTVAGIVAGTDGTVVGTAGTVAVLAEVANSSDSAGGGAVFLKVDYSQCLISKNCVLKWIFTRTFQASMQE